MNRLNESRLVPNTLRQTTVRACEVVQHGRVTADEPVVFPDPVEELSIPAELLEVFRLEADDHLRTLRTQLTECYKQPANHERWAEVRRAAHTLKGVSAMLGFGNVTQLAHRMEDLFDRYFEGTRIVTAGELDLLLACTDAIDDMIAGRHPIRDETLVHGPSDRLDPLMQPRMMPLSSLVPQLQQIVRVASQECGKVVELVLEDEQSDLDAGVVKRMAAPLLHLMRNAVDHGIEAPRIRTAFGKPATGTIVLRATNEGNQVVLTIQDDGRGIDASGVRGTIVRRGMLSNELANRLDEDELFDYLFRPGFSTKEVVTKLSGRGVGLDVVKTTIAALSGTITVTSVSGHGTTFTIRLPRTLASPCRNT